MCTLRSWHVPIGFEFAQDIDVILEFLVKAKVEKRLAERIYILHKACVKTGVMLREMLQSMQE